MNKYFKENINKIIHLNLLMKDINCNFFLKKNGKFKYIPLFESFNQYFCLIKKITYLNLIKFPNLNSINEDEIIKKLLILKYSQKFNLKYINLGIYIYLFNDNIPNIEEITTNIMLLSYINKLKNLKKLNNYFYGNIIKKLTTSFMIIKKTSKYSNKNIFIYIFYKFYIHIIEEELYNKYSKTLNHFPNYNELYIFLKKNGYIKKYYNDYVKIITKNYLKFYKKLETNKLLKKFKKEIKNKIKNFNEINLLNCIDKNISDKFNKIYIKNKFIDLSKNYNM